MEKEKFLMITYLCGGINGLTDDQCKNWREVAKIGLKTDCLDPMRRDYRGIEETNVNEIVDGDLIDIAPCHFILVNATTPSWGTAMEIVYAFQQGKTIVAFVGEGTRVSPWLRYHCNFICESLNMAIGYINNEINITALDYN